MLIGCNKEIDFIDRNIEDKICVETVDNINHICKNYIYLGKIYMISRMPFKLEKYKIIYQIIIVKTSTKKIEHNTVMTSPEIRRLVNLKKEKLLSNIIYN